VNATATIAAITAARTTDGSARVRTTNHARTTQVKNNRVDKRRVRNHGPTAANTYATF
jgi:hypothetical protein